MMDVWSALSLLSIFSVPFSELLEERGEIKWKHQISSNQQMLPLFFWGCSWNRYVISVHQQGLCHRYSDSDYVLGPVSQAFRAWLFPGTRDPSHGLVLWWALGKTLHFWHFPILPQLPFLFRYFIIISFWETLFAPVLYNIELLKNGLGWVAQDCLFSSMSM